MPFLAGSILQMNLNIPEQSTHVRRMPDDCSSNKCFSMFVPPLKSIMTWVRSKVLQGAAMRQCIV